MEDRSPGNRGLPPDKSSSEKATFPAENQKVLRWSTRLKLPDSAFGRSKRRKAPIEPQQERVLTEKELREEAAWKQVEDTGKPVLFDGTLLIPEGMSVWKAFEYLPDGVREQATHSLEQTVAGAYRILFNGAENQLREKAKEQGKLEWFDALPSSAKGALAESVVREQLNMPEIPFEEILERWTTGSRSAESKPDQPRSEKAKGRRKKSEEVTLAVIEKPSSVDRTRAEPSAAIRQGVPTKKSQVLDWNVKHHGLLLKRLAQVRAYLTDDEQAAIDALLARKIGKAEIDQIDEITKGCEWVRRLEHKSP